MKITVQTPGGEEKILDARSEYTLMEIIRDSGLDILAQCGGGCSCATCHVHVAPEWADRLTPRSADEVDLLESSEHYDPTVSRLSCQIICTPEIDGLRVTIQKDAWGG